MKACVFPGCGAYGDGTAATQQANRLSKTRDGQASSLSRRAKQEPRGRTWRAFWETLGWCRIRGRRLFQSELPGLSLPLVAFRPDFGMFLSFAEFPSQPPFSSKLVNVGVDQQSSTR